MKIILYIFGIFLILSSELTAADDYRYIFQTDFERNENFSIKWNTNECLTWPLFGEKLTQTGSSLYQGHCYRRFSADENNTFARFETYPFDRRNPAGDKLTNTGGGELTRDWKRMIEDRQDGFEESRGKTVEYRYSFRINDLSMFEKDLATALILGQLHTNNGAVKYSGSESCKLHCYAIETAASPSPVLQLYKIGEDQYELRLIHKQFGEDRILDREVYKPATDDRIIQIQHVSDYDQWEKSFL